MTIPDEINKIKDIIIKTIPIEKLYLFGSYANGTPTEDSDYDFYAVLPNDGMRPGDAIYEIYLATGKMKRSKPMDVLAGTVETFENRSRFLTMERTISREGIVLYDRKQE